MNLDLHNDVYLYKELYEWLQSTLTQHEKFTLLYTYI